MIETNVVIAFGLCSAVWGIESDWCGMISTCNGLTTPCRFGLAAGSMLKLLFTFGHQGEVLLQMGNSFIQLVLVVVTRRKAFFEAISHRKLELQGNARYPN